VCLTRKKKHGVYLEEKDRTEISDIAFANPLSCLFPPTVTGMTSRPTILADVFGSGRSKRVCSYKVTQNGCYPKSSTRNYQGIQNQLCGFLESLLLPEGYPDTVSPEYAEFQFWDSVQALCSYLRGMLCTRALLLGVGVGVDGASATSAALQWVLMDGVGHIGGMLFAWTHGACFGQNVRKWRLFADCINDIGLTLELVAPLFPDHFLAFASLGCACRAMCGVAGGATRCVLSAHFAKADNLAGSFYRRDWAGFLCCKLFL